MLYHIVYYMTIGEFNYYVYQFLSFSVSTGLGKTWLNFEDLFLEYIEETMMNVILLTVLITCFFIFFYSVLMNAKCV